jgi:hypothetical protein
MILLVIGLTMGEGELSGVQRSRYTPEKQAYIKQSNVSVYDIGEIGICPDFLFIKIQIRRRFF